MDKLGRRGYVHWLLPIFILIFIVGFFAARMMRTTFLSVVCLIIVGLGCGHIVYNRQKISFFSSALLLFAFVVGYTLNQELLRAKTVVVVFLLSCIAAYVFEGYLDR